MTDVSYTCPICGRTTHNPYDVEQGWCSACAGLTSEPPPTGMVWVVFRGGALDRRGRLLVQRWLSDGEHYHHPSGDSYVYTDGVYWLVAAS